jgi:hypothetical protein
VKTDEFERWFQGLPAELRAKVTAVIQHIVEVGSTRRGAHVKLIRGSRLHKMKEARIDRGTRMLFAFDSNGDPVMLVGGDKTGKWNRWYPPNVQRAEKLYLNHERSIGKEGRCLSQREARRMPSQMSR